MLIQEMNTEFPLESDRSVTSIGRQRSREGRPGNDIVIRLPDDMATNRISRFQVELRWAIDGLELKSVTDQSVVVDGKTLGRNEVAPLSVGSQAQLSEVATLHFLAAEEEDEDLSDSGATVFVKTT